MRLWPFTRPGTPSSSKLLGISYDLVTIDRKHINGPHAHNTLIIPQPTEFHSLSDEAKAEVIPEVKKLIMINLAGEVSVGLHLPADDITGIDSDIETAGRLIVNYLRYGEAGESAHLPFPEKHSLLMKWIDEFRGEALSIAESPKVMQTTKIMAAHLRQETTLTGELLRQIQLEIQPILDLSQ